jgi:hypothetical protein
VILGGEEVIVEVEPPDRLLVDAQVVHPPVLRPPPTR